MTKKHSTKSKGRSWWSAQIDAWRKSGLSQRVFCEERGLKESTFSRWHRKLKFETSESTVATTTARPSFVTVELPVVDKPLVRVSLGAVTVDFETLPPPAWIMELATCGGSRC